MAYTSQPALNSEHEQNMISRDIYAPQDSRVSGESVFCQTRPPGVFEKLLYGNRFNHHLVAMIVLSMWLTFDISFQNDG